MCWVSIDIEADGPIPSEYSMISIGAVIIEDSLEKTFYAELKPVSKNFVPESLSISGFTREETLKFEEPNKVMYRFKDWLNQNCKSKPYFISDNNGFDWQFVNWYFHYFLGENPFGYNSSNLRSLYQGLNVDMNVNFKHLRKTEHTHNALDDAIGNAEVFLEIQNKFKIKGINKMCPVQPYL